MENWPPLASLDGSRNTPERCPRPWDSTQEDQEIAQENQIEDLITNKAEVKEGENLYLTDDYPCKKISTDLRDTQRDVKAEEQEEEHVRIKEEEIPIKICTDVLNIQKPPERCHRPLYSWDSKEEHHEIPWDDQSDDENFIKVEVKEEADRPSVKVDEPCKEEEIPPEICQDGQYRNKVKRYPSASLNGDIEHRDLLAESTGQNCLTPNLHLAFDSADYSIEVNGKGSESFSQGTDLTSHQRGPQKDKPFSCSECWKCFTLKQQLIRHQRTHSAEKPFSCSECGKCFPEKWMLAKHQTNHSGEKPFSCTECGRYFSTRRNLISHQMTHTGERPFSCSECGKCFSQKSTLTTHEKIHTGVKPYSCSECGKCFSHKSSLIGHEKVHTGEKPFSCKECGRCFSLKSNLITHEKVHTGVKPYSCSQCGKCFTHKSSLVKHEKVHTGEKPFSCSECGKRFCDRTHLIFHQRSHTGEKPFPCTECGKCFARKSVLIEHGRLHRGNKSQFGLVLDIFVFLFDFQLTMSFI